jgi:hypothetical protein
MHETHSSAGRNIGIGKPLFEADDSDALKLKGENNAEAAVATADEVAKQCGLTVSFAPAVENPAAARAASRAKGSMGGGAETVSASPSEVPLQPRAEAGSPGIAAFMRFKLRNRGFCLR